MKKLLLLFITLLLFIPQTLATEKERGEVVRGFFFGDTHFGRAFEYFDASNKKEPEEFFNFFYDESGNAILGDMDFVSVNFESSLYNEQNRCPNSQKSVILATHEKYLSNFKNAGITHFGISNNHSYDCGKTNFEFMENALEKASLSYYGDGRIGEENDLLQEIGGHKIAFLGFNETTFFNDWDKKSQKVKKYTDDGYSVIVNIHWGKEYKTENNHLQKEIANKMVDAGSVLIIGHHPHVVQNYDVIKGVPVFYSLGNFMFDQPFPETLTGMGVYVEISEDLKFKTVYFDRSNPFYDIKKLDFGL